MNFAFLLILGFRASCMSAICMVEEKDLHKLHFYTLLRENNNSCPVHTVFAQMCPPLRNNHAHAARIELQITAILANKSSASVQWPQGTKINGEKAVPSHRSHQSLVNNSEKHQRCIGSSNALNLSQDKVPLV